MMFVLFFSNSVYAQCFEIIRVPNNGMVVVDIDRSSLIPNLLFILLYQKKIVFHIFIVPSQIELNWYSRSV